MAQAAVQDDLYNLVASWRLDPERFVRDVFQVEPDAWQIEAMRDIAMYDRVSIRSGHGIGKSAMLAWTILWWICTRIPCKVACTAPTAHQLNDVLWGEIAHWHQKMYPAIRERIDVKAERVELREAPRQSFAVARTARKEQPEAFQGFHSPHMLFIADEASGVEDIIFQVGQGAMSTKGAKTLLVGNPTRASGFFYDSHTKMRSMWKTRKVSCMDARMVEQTFIDTMRMQYGEDSNVYRVRVLGEFPTEEDSAVIPLEPVMEATTRNIKTPERGKNIWGLDVARFGDDDSALAKRNGPVLIEPVMVWRKMDTMQTSGKVIAEYEKTPKRDRPDEILVDVIGIGAGVVDRLKEQGYPVRGVNVAESPAVDSRLFMRKRDELWWKGREWFLGRSCRIPETDDGLVEELIAPTYTYTSGGKIQVESKADMKKRGVKSPNRADAFLLTFDASDRPFSRELSYPNLGIV